MYLKRIIISNFKNICSADLSFSSKINCISGNNGEGKTNLLDAIYYLSMTKSYFNASDSYTFTFGQSVAALNGCYVREDHTEDRISVAMRAGGEKSVKKNDKSYSRISEHIGYLPIVMVSPSDTSLINGSGEERRKFINSILSQVDKEYLRRVMRYNQMLAQRNKLLKMERISFELLETINERMAPDAAYIYEKRLLLCNRLQQLIAEYYNRLSGDKESVSLRYTSDLEEYMGCSASNSGNHASAAAEIVSPKAPSDDDFPESEAFQSDTALVRLFEKVKERDAVLRYTSAGIQRDDIDFSLGEHPIKRCGSQGQQKSFLIALKLAQFTLMKELHGAVPILLLDDVFDKLDMQRVEYLLGLVASEEFGQIFITDSNKVRMERIASSFTDKVASFEVVSGVYGKRSEDISD